MITRKEIRTLCSQDLLRFREAMEEIQKNGSYYILADFHGNPLNYCPHSNINVLFLAWHRYYIYLLEQELLKIDAGVSLPYWDWTDETTFKDPLASAHKDKTYTSSTGATKDNPLFDAFVEDRKTKTSRNGVPSPFVLSDAKNKVAIALKSTSLLELNNHLYGPHGDIHTGIRGTFGSAAQAAFDPVFWSHHATVDRQWAIWQKTNPVFEIPDITLGKPFEKIKVAEVVDYRSQFGYEYDNLNFVPPNPKPIVLAMVDIITTEEPIYIDVFLVKPGTGEKVRASSFGIFGMGKMEMHHHHSPKFNEYMDISEAIAKLEIDPGTIDPRKHIQFEIFDENGNKLKPEILQFEKIFIDQLK